MSDPKFLLIDYGSFQPGDLDAFKDQDWLIRIFVGAGEPDLEVAKVSSLQAFGAGLEYIQIDGDGPAATDIHIAFHIGQLAAVNLQAKFCVVSASSGLRPLLKYLGKLGIECLMATPASTSGRRGRFH